MTSLRFRRIPSALRWIGGIIIVLVVVLLCLSLINWNAARGPLSRMISRRLERQVTIGAPLRVHLLSATPSADVENLIIANPAWAGGGNMIELPHLHVALVLWRLLLGHVVLETLEIDDPKVALLRDDSGRANWEFGPPKPKQNKPTRLPATHHFALRGGSLSLNDAIQKLTFYGSVVAAEQGRSHEGSEPFRLRGQGTLNKEPFKLEFEGDALLHIDPEHPYRFQMTVDAGPSRAVMKGSIARPFDLGVFDADLELKGQNLANLYYLTHLALPLTPPYQMSVHVHRDGNHFSLDDIAGKIGNSDVHGKGTVELAQKDARPRLTANLVSRSLDLADLGVALGAGVPQQGSPGAAERISAPKAQPISPLLLPTFQFQFDRLRSMDATVEFRAGSVQTQKIPLKDVAFNLKLDRGVLDINPVDFDLPQGKLAGQIRLDSNGKTPDTTMDIRLDDVHLDQFKSKKESTAPLQGIMEGRIRVEGHGNSVHAIAADANGTISAVIPHGEMQEAFAELAGIDLVRGLGLLLDKTHQSVPIRCGIAAFDVKDGDAQAQRLVFDTQNVLITGGGHITLSDEKLDLDLKGQPKKFRLGRVSSPINVRGTLRHPSVGLSAGAVAKQGAIAVALAAIATPIAATLAFIDTGLAKNADCAALIQDTQQETRSPPSPAHIKQQARSQKPTQSQSQSQKPAPLDSHVK